MTLSEPNKPVQTVDLAPVLYMLQLRIHDIWFSFDPVANREWAEKHKERATANGVVARIIQYTPQEIGNEQEENQAGAGGGSASGQGSREADQAGGQRAGQEDG